MSQLMTVNPRPPPLPLGWRLRAAWTKARQAPGRALKLAAMRFSTSVSRAWWAAGWRVGATRHDYAGEVGDGRGSAIVMACVRKVQRTFPEAPPRVQVRTSDDTLAAQPRHALQRLLDRPNPYYSGLLLWSATLADYMLGGNAYWLKVRSPVGRVVELWWVPSSVIDPKWPEAGDGTVFISHYEYRVNGRNLTIAPEDVVHFRDGLDPDNVRKGLSPLGSLFREIATDDHAANWTAALLRNMGVPGVILAPADDAVISTEDAEQAKTEFSQRFGGDRRGEPLVMRTKTQVSVLSFNPQQMVLRELRQITEERVSAVLGPSAVVVGLGAGLARSIFANYAEAREDLYESLIIPMQRVMAADVNHQLTPDFGDPETLVVDFDLSRVRILQEDQNALHERARADLLSGIPTLNEARAMVGLEALPEGDVFYLPNTVTPTEAANLIPPEPEPEPTAVAASGAAGGQQPPADEGERQAAVRSLARTNGHAPMLAEVPGA